MSVENIYKKISLNIIPDAEKEMISQSFVMRKFRRNEVIISQDMDCDRLFFVVRGALRVFYLNKAGREVTRSLVFEDEFCTNLLSFSRQEKNNENIQCLEDAIVFSIHRDQFYQMIEGSCLMAKLYAEVLETFINRHLKRFQFMNMLSERERVEEFLKSNSEIKARIKDKIIASHLGVSPEYYCRVKSEALSKK